MNEMKFTVLGPRGSGKTTLLSCIYEEFAKELPGKFSPADTHTADTLKSAYKSLRREADKPGTREFESPVEATHHLREYPFTIKGKRAKLNVRFYDFPGSWIDPGNVNNERVINIVKSSAVIIVAINTPYLMEFGGRYVDDEWCSVDEIEWAVKRGLEGSESQRLILFVPIKCERWLETHEERENLIRAVKNAFHDTLTLSYNPLYRGKLAMALLPVQTAGNVSFRRFKFDSDGRITSEVYRKNPGKRFRPVNVDQPMRYLMSFILNQFAENSSRFRKFMRLIFFRGDLSEVAREIRRGMKSDYDLPSGFEIFCGRDLIGFPSHN